MLPGHLICAQCYAQHLCTLCHQQQASALWTSQNTQDRNSEAGRARPPSDGDSQSRLRKEEVMKTLALSFSLAWLLRTKENQTFGLQAYQVSFG